MTNDLIVIEKKRLDCLPQINGLDPIIDRIRQEVSSLVPDTSTKKAVILLQVPQ